MNIVSLKDNRRILCIVFYGELSVMNLYRKVTIGPEEAEVNFDDLEL